MKLGIMGGTFDPIHLGHLRTAEEVGEELDLGKVYLIPSASPPHKSGKFVTPFSHRFAMAQRAADLSPLLDVLDLEAKRPGPSFSIETLQEMHALFQPQPELYFILGMDAFLEIETWKNYQELFDYAHFVIIQRPGYDQERLGPFLEHLPMNIRETRDPTAFLMPSGLTLLLKKTTLMDISSTKIRRLASREKSIRFLVSDAVENYISMKGLYRTTHANPEKSKTVPEDY